MYGGECCEGFVEAGPYFVILSDILVILDNFMEQCIGFGWVKGNIDNAVNVKCTRVGGLNGSNETVSWKIDRLVLIIENESVLSAAIFAPNPVKIDFIIRFG